MRRRPQGGSLRQIFAGTAMVMAPLLASLLAPLPLVGVVTPLAGQATTAGTAQASAHPNYALPPAVIEERLEREPFQIVGMQDNRWQGDRTQRAALKFRDGTVMRVKWARAAQGGFAINNQPRYEMAAYLFQKLILDEDDWVVPPTVMREMPLRSYRQLDPEMKSTFEGTQSILVNAQYWLQAVAPLEGPDLARFETDEAYARRLAILNMFTYLIRHVDSNSGNVLISVEGEPRMFAVDNGVAFRSPESPRGTVWKTLHVDRLPADAVDRLRGLTRARLDSTLAVVAQFRVREDGRLEATSPDPKIHPNRGVDRHGDIVQMGLTDLELDELWERREALLVRLDSGKLSTF